MAEIYDSRSATHYAAYRPALHPIILGRVLPPGASFRAGLDVGCGTGYSALALAAYCRRVYGVDPSRSMLRAATPHARITYLTGTGEALPLPDDAVDVVTFAGSLYYAKSPGLTRELKRVCRGEARIIPYDFEVSLYDVVRRCGVEVPEAAADYDHEIGFSDVEDFEQVVAGRERVEVAVAPADLAHLLLSEITLYDRFLDKYGADDPFQALTADLEAAGGPDHLPVDVYYTEYRLR